MNKFLIRASRPGRAGPRQWLQWRHRLMSPALDLGHLNDLNDIVVVEVDVEEALKS